MILLTGGTGYIGSHTFVEMLNNNIDAIGVDNYSNSHSQVVNRISTITQKAVRVFDVDLRDTKRLDEIFKAYKFKAVIHFAGYKAVGESVNDPLKYYDNNVSGTLSLLQVMINNNVKKLVFSSSATVYAPIENEPITEASHLLPSNPYGQTKLVIEQMLRELYLSNPEWSISILRYFNPVGAHQSSLLGEDPQGIPNNLFPYILKVATGQLPFLNIFGCDYKTNDGTGVRDYIHVCDLASGHIKALDEVLSRPGFEIYNLGTGNGYSVLDVINTLERVSGVKIPFKFAERRAGDIGSCYANPEKIFNSLGWRAKKSLEEMCQDSWNWHMKNPEGYKTKNNLL